MIRKPPPKHDPVDWWYELDGRVRSVLLAVGILLVIVLVAGVIWSTGALFKAGQRAEATPGVGSPTAAAGATPTIAPTVGNTRAMPATWTPTPAHEEPSPTPSPTPSPAPQSQDPQGDLSLYDSGEPAEEVPGGADIRAAGIGPDLRISLRPGVGAPQALDGWAGEGEILLWIELFEPLPDPPTSYVEYVVALDVDGDSQTGRPVGSARINPDLGMEVAIAGFYDPQNGQYGTYFMVWNSAQSALVRQSAEAVRFTLDQSRTIVGLAIPLDTLTEAVTQASGIDIAPDAARGRAAAWTRVGGQRVIDFCPNP